MSKISHNLSGWVFLFLYLCDWYVCISGYSAKIQYLKQAHIRDGLLFLSFHVLLAYLIRCNEWVIHPHTLQLSRSLFNTNRPKHSYSLIVSKHRCFTWKEYLLHKGHNNATVPRSLLMWIICPGRISHTLTTTQTLTANQLWQFVSMLRCFVWKPTLPAQICHIKSIDVFSKKWCFFTW